MKTHTKTDSEHVKGIVSGTRYSYGWLRSEDGLRVFLPPPQMSRCLDGDEVTARIIPSTQGRTEAILTSIHQSHFGQFIGTVKQIGSNLFIIPDHPRIKQRFIVPALKRDEQKSGDIVIAECTQHPFDHAPRAETIKVICSSSDQAAVWKVAAARQGMEISFQDTDPKITHDADIRSCEDLTMTPFITIDGDHTRDIDDALYIQKNADGSFQLTVAIADPDRFIRAGDEHDRKAFEKSASCYLPGLTIPMLSRELSENRASLIEGKVRSAVCCKMDVDADGYIRNHAFSLARIVTHARLSYDQVQQVIDGNNADHPFCSMIESLHAFMKQRTQWRKDNAVPNPTYYQHNLNVSGYALQSVEPFVSTDAHAIVEESMVAANMAFAQFMHEKNLPCIYRRQDGFKPALTDMIARRLGAMNFDVKKYDLSIPGDYLSLVREVSLRQDPAIHMMLKSMLSPAYSSVERGPHVAMGVESYATFTSPLRRYADLLNHRSLKHYLNTGSALPELPQGICEHLDKKAQTFNKVSAEIKSYLLALYYDRPEMKGHICKARVISLHNGYTARVELIDSGAHAWINYRSRGSHVSLSEDGLSLIKMGVRAVRLADLIDVVVEGADVSEKKVLVSLAE